MAIIVSKKGSATPGSGKQGSPRCILLCLLVDKRGAESGGCVDTPSHISGAFELEVDSDACFATEEAVKSDYAFQAIHQSRFLTD